jgi:hypothetical protein
VYCQLPKCHSCITEILQRVDSVERSITTSIINHPAIQTFEKFGRRSTRSQHWNKIGRVPISIFILTYVEICHEFVYLLAIPDSIIVNRECLPFRQPAKFNKRGLMQNLCSTKSIWRTESTRPERKSIYCARRMLMENAGANSAAIIRFWQALKFTGALFSLCNAIPLQGTYVWLMLIKLKTLQSNIFQEL